MKECIEMKTMKKLLPLSLALALALTVTACGKKEAAEKTHIDEEVLKAGVLTVGISTDYPPFESLDTQGNIVGYDVDMAKYLADQIKTKDGASYTLDFVQMEFSNIISALQTGQVDVGIAAFSYDPERDCLFTDPYYLSAQVVVVRKDSGIESLDDLKGKSIAAGTGTTGYAEAEKIENATVSSPGDYLQQFELLRVNQIDAVVCDKTVGEGYVNSGDDLMILDTLVEEDLCITVKKGNTNILNALNEAIGEFISSGTSDEYKATWDLLDE